MTITDANGALFTQRLGVERVVVGRELSIDEIASVGKSGVEIEAFVHGALCVSYSGQCYSSEAWGGRSANRGQCAQVPCCPAVLPSFLPVLLCFCTSVLLCSCAPVLLSSPFFQLPLS